MLPEPRSASASEVPVLDLAPLFDGNEVEDLAAALRRGCETTGFFYIKNHRVPAPMIDEVFGATRRYFGLPLEERLRNLIDDRFRRGFMPTGINQHPGYPPDLKESYGFGVDLPLDDPDVVAGRPLHGPNQWPVDHLWLRAACEAYFREMVRLSSHLFELIAVSLGLRRDYFLPYSRKTMTKTLLFHYPPQAPNSDDDLMGVVSHTDYGMVTILAQDPVGGLELQKLDGEWIGAPYIPGTFVINLGDLMQRWTNDVYRSNLHRVINRRGRERYSIATFCELDYTTPVACLETCCSSENPARYPPIEAGEYILSRNRDVQKYGKRTVDHFEIG